MTDQPDIRNLAAPTFPSRSSSGLRPECCCVQPTARRGAESLAQQSCHP